MLQNLNWNTAVDGFPLLPPNPSLSKPSFNVIVLQPKTHFHIQGADVHTALTKELRPKELTRVRITGPLDKQWRALLVLSGACVCARIFPFLKRKKFSIHSIPHFLGEELKGIGEIGNLDLETMGLFLEWCHGKREPQRNAGKGELRPRTYILKGILPNNMSISVKLGAYTLFMEIRNYSSNFKTSPVIYFRAIFIA